MSAVHFRTVAAARQDIKQLIDAAEAGIPSAVTRGNERVAVVEVDRLREILQAARPARAQVEAENDGWSITLPGLPIAADGGTFDEALSDLIDALREYADDWTERLRLARNHAGNWALVQLVALSSDDQLKEWLRA